MTSPIVLQISSKRTDEIAIVYNNRKITYSELNNRSDWIAQWLLAQKKHSNWSVQTRIALYMQPSDDYVITLLAILKAGMEFLPLDANRKPDELQTCLQELNVDLILYDAYFCRHAQALSKSSINIESIKEATTTPIDLTTITCSPWAYIIYTSGSSGTPKAVHVHHDQIVPRVEHIRDMIGISSQDCLAQLCAIEFDASLQEIFTALVCGATLKVIPQHIRRDPQSLMRTFENITIATIVPETLVKLDPEHYAFETLKAIIGTGSRLDDHQMRRWLARGVRFFNGYGATEQTFGSHLTEIKIDNGELSNHLGNPMNGIQQCFRVISPADDQKVYLSLEEIASTTEYELITFPHNNQYLNSQPQPDSGFITLDGGISAYATGDVIQLDEQRHLLYVRRMGNSIKRNGKLIDLERINQYLNAMAQTCNIMELSVLADQEYVDTKNTSDLIVFYQRLNECYPIDVVQFNMLCSALMLQERPTHFFEMAEGLPRTTAKQVVDKHALREVLKQQCHNKMPIRGLDKTDLNRVEKIISAIWASILYQDESQPVSRDDNFLNFCANSIDLVEMTTKIVDTFKEYLLKPEQLGYSGPLEFYQAAVEKDATLARLAREVILKLDLKRFCDSALYHSTGDPLKSRLIAYNALASDYNTQSQKSAVILIHSLSGDARKDYKELKKAYESVADVFFISAPLLSGQDSNPSTIEEFAHYYNVILSWHYKHYEHIRLVGWSAGGIIVYEMLLQLQSDQPIIAEKISGAMVDSYAPIMWHCMDIKSFKLFLRKLPEQLRLDAGSKIADIFNTATHEALLKTFSKQTLISQLLNSMPKSLKGTSRNKVMDQLYSVKNILYALFNYTPSASINNCRLYLASDPVVSVKDITQGTITYERVRLWWRNVFEYKLIPQTDHMSIVQAREFHATERGHCSAITEKMGAKPIIDILVREYSQLTMELPFVESGSAAISNFYVPPTITQKKALAAIDHGECVPTDRTLDYKDIFRFNQKEHDRHILVAGQGSGKTALSVFLVDQWARGLLWKEIDLLVLIPFRQVLIYAQRENNDDLSGLIAFLYPHTDNAMFKKFFDVVFSKKTNLNIYFIADGFNEVAAFLKSPSIPLAKLIRKIAALENILITTQEQSLDCAKQLLGVDKTSDVVLELQGLNDVSQMELLINNFFKLLCKPKKQQQQFLVWLVDHYEKFKDMMHRPLLLFFLCSICDSIAKLAIGDGNICEVYQRFGLALYRQYLVRNGVSHEVTDDEVMELTKPLHEIVMRMGFDSTMQGIAALERDFVVSWYCTQEQDKQRYHTLMNLIIKINPDFSFNSQLANSNFNELLKTGFITVTKEDTVVFVHDSIRFYMAALYVSTMWKVYGPKYKLIYKKNAREGSTIKHIIKKICVNPDYNDFFIHLIGLLHEQDKLQLQQYDSSSQSDSDADITNSEKEETSLRLCEELFIVLRLKIDSLDPIDIVRNAHTRLAQPLVLGVQLLGLCCKTTDEITKFKDATPFINKLKTLFSTILIESAVFTADFRHQIYTLLYTYPQLREALNLAEYIQPFCFKNSVNNNDRISCYLERIETMRASFHTLLDKASKEDNYRIQHAIIKNLSVYSGRRLFDLNCKIPMTEVSYRDTMLCYLATQPPVGSNPRPIFYIMMRHVELIDQAFFQAYRQCMESKIAQRDTRTLTCGAYVINALLKRRSPLDFSDAICALMGAILESDLYDRQNVRVFLLQNYIELKHTTLKDNDPRNIFNTFTYLVKSYQRIRKLSSHYEPLCCISKAFWGKYKSTITEQLYVQCSFEQSFFQKQIRSIVEFMYSTEIQADIEELTHNMLDDRLIAKTLSVQSVAKLYTRTSQRVQFKLKRFFQSFILESVNKQTHQKDIKAYGFALCALLNNNIQVKNAGGNLYNIFHFLSFSFKNHHEQYILECISNIIINGHLNMPREYYQFWIRDCIYKFDHISYERTSLPMLLLKVIAKLVSNDLDQLQGLLERLRQHLLKNKDYQTITDVTILMQRLLDQHQDQLFGVKLGALTGELIKQLFANIYVNHKPLRLLTFVCVQDYLITQTSTKQISLFSYYIREAITYLTIDNQYYRRLSVLQSLFLALKFNRLGDEDVRMLKSCAIMRLYDLDSIVGVAACCILIELGEPVVQPDITRFLSAHVDTLEMTIAKIAESENSPFFECAGLAALRRSLANSTPPSGLSHSLSVTVFAQIDHSNSAQFNTVILRKP